MPFSAFLLTPLREGRRLALIIACAAGAISTHAPAGGATRRQQGSHTVRSISTHAPAGGATYNAARPRFENKLFLLTPLREGRRIGGAALGLANGDFYSRPCGRGDRSGRNKPFIQTNFYSRPCGRGDGSFGVPDFFGRKFLLTPLREGRRFLWQASVMIYVFLLTPLREGRQSRFRFQQAHDAISTHAPAGGATYDFDSALCQLLISTHAPAGGATSKDVNPDALSSISTHAPAGGATGRLAGASGCSPDFYSRPCGRGDSIWHPFPLNIRLFLLTPLREGRPGCQQLADLGDVHFYSRPCGRGDVCETGSAAALHSISTHAPAGGATNRILAGWGG